MILSTRRNPCRVKFIRIPGTVAYVGYGSLYERRDYLGDAWISGAGDYLGTRRGFFMKASYLYRF